MNGLVTGLPGLQLPRPCQEKNLSLSMMAEACTGRPLDKSMQVSKCDLIFPIAHPAYAMLGAGLSCVFNTSLRDFGGHSVAASHLLLTSRVHLQVGQTAAVGEADRVRSAGCPCQRADL